MVAGPRACGNGTAASQSNSCGVSLGGGRAFRHLELPRLRATSPCALERQPREPHPQNSTDLPLVPGEVAPVCTSPFPVVAAILQKHLLAQAVVQSWLQSRRLDSHQLTVVKALAGVFVGHCWFPCPGPISSRLGWAPRLAHR